MNQSERTGPPPKFSTVYNTHSCYQPAGAFELDTHLQGGDLLKGQKDQASEQGVTERQKGG